MDGFRKIAEAAIFAAEAFKKFSAAFAETNKEKN